MKRTVAIPTILAVAIAGGASAANSAAPDPAAGEVSAASPTTSFSGSITEPTGAVEILFLEQGTSKGQCEEPTCQEYTLTVRDGGSQLAVDSLVDDDGFSQTVEIEDPSGTISQTSAADPGTVKAKVKNPAPGTWLIRIYGSDYIDGPNATWTYDAKVTLTPVGGDPAPPPTPPSPGASPPSPSASTTLKATAKRLSARKLNRAKAVKLKVTASAEVRNLQVAVYTGKANRPRLTGRARVGSMSGTRTITVKLKRKVKPGRLQVAMRGTDADGAPVDGRATLRVRR